MAKTDLTAECLREILYYDPETGAFNWRAPKYGRRKNGRVGTINSCGYHAIVIGGTKFLAHRLAWLYMYGKQPSEFIDHINGDRSDNRLCNLREATNGENNQNRFNCSSHNKSGLLGVKRSDSKVQRWNARIRVDGKVFCLGSFDSPELAHQAYKDAKREKHAFCTI